MARAFGRVLVGVGVSSRVLGGVGLSARAIRLQDAWVLGILNGAEIVYNGRREKMVRM